MPHAVTTTDVFLEQISGQLAVQNELLGKLVGVLAPEPATAPEPGVAPDNEPEPKKAPVKKAAARKRVTGQ
jgi:hypothetical protein